MIQEQTLVKISDNSGAKIAKCIKVLGGFKKKYAKIGDFIIVSIKELRNKEKENTKVKRGEVYKALVLRTKAIYNSKKLGSQIIFNENSVALINKQGNPIGTRILGPVLRALKKKKLQKFISISSELIQ